MGIAEIMPTHQVPSSMVLFCVLTLGSSASAYVLGSFVRPQLAVGGAPRPCTTTGHVLMQELAMPIKDQMLAFLGLWEDDEDGDADECTTTMAFEFLADRVQDEHKAPYDELLPALDEVFDAVLGECDEACVTINKMKKKLAQM